MAGKPFFRPTLFANASGAVKQYARQSFARTPAGNLVQTLRRNVMRAGKGGAAKDAAQKIRQFAEKYTRGGPVAVGMKLLRGTDLGNLLGEVEKYARKGGGGAGAYNLLRDFMQSLGPAGKLVASLLHPHGKGGKSTGAMGGLKAELQTAMDFIGAFAGDDEAFDIARQIIEARGGQVIPPGGKEVTKKHRVRGTEPPPEKTAKGKQRTTVDVTVDGKKMRLPIRHPIVTGDFVLTPGSSNVFGYGYDLDNWYLYVRYKEADPNHPGQKKNSPGSLYRYANVPPRVFMKFYSKVPNGGGKGAGTFIWDNVRVRGTLSGHRFDYELVGIQAGYVPRKATLMADGEWFIEREVKVSGGGSARSAHPSQLVRPLRPGRSAGPNGAPNTGAPRGPNRGRPNTGRP